MENGYLLLSLITDMDCYFLIFPIMILTLVNMCSNYLHDDSDYEIRINYQTRFTEYFIQIPYWITHFYFIQMFFQPLDKLLVFSLILKERIKFN